MRHEITVPIEGKPYFLYNDLDDSRLFYPIRSVTMKYDDDSKQAWEPKFADSNPIQDVSLEEIATQGLTLSVHIPKNGFIILDVIDACRKFASIANEDYVSVKMVEINNYRCYTLPLGTDENGVMVCEVKPRLFKIACKV